jgi:hypothetical protein
MKRGFISPETGLYFWDWLQKTSNLSPRWVTEKQYLAYSRKRRENYRKNKERCLRQSRASSVRNAERVKARTLVWLLKNREALKERAKDYRVKNKAAISEYLKTRYHTDTKYRNMVIARGALRSAIIRGAKKDKSWSEAVQFIVDTKPADTGYEVDHLIPVSRFLDTITHYGVNDPENLRWITREENRVKADRMPSEKEINNHLDFVQNWRTVTHKKTQTYHEV